MRAAIIFVFFSIGSVLSFAQEADDSTTSDSLVYLPKDIDTGDTATIRAASELQTTRAYQSEDMVVKQFDEAKWKSIVGNTNYSEEPPDAPDLRNLSLPWAGPVLKVIGYGLIVAMVIALLYYLVKNVKFGPKPEKKVQSADVESTAEDIEELDIEKLLDQAKREGNYRLAVRLYYLGLLKRLNQVGKIAWKKDKTNRDYLSELFSRDFYYGEVRSLTHSFEAVWYGDHALSAESFDRLRKNFETLFVQIKPAE